MTDETKLTKKRRAPRNASYRLLDRVKLFSSQEKLLQRLVEDRGRSLKDAAEAEFYDYEYAKELMQKLYEAKGFSGPPGVPLRLSIDWYIDKSGVIERRDELSERLARLDSRVAEALLDGARRATSEGHARIASPATEEARREAALRSVSDLVIRLHARVACRLDCESNTFRLSGIPRLHLVGMWDADAQQVLKLDRPLRVETPTGSLVVRDAHPLNLIPAHWLPEEWLDEASKWRRLWDRARKYLGARLAREVGNEPVVCVVTRVDLAGLFELSCPAYDECVRSEFPYLKALASLFDDDEFDYFDQSTEDSASALLKGHSEEVIESVAAKLAAGFSSDPEVPLFMRGLVVGSAPAVQARGFEYEPLLEIVRGAYEDINNRDVDPPRISAEERQLIHSIFATTEQENS